MALCLVIGARETIYDGLGSVAVTGDEPRYNYYGISFLNGSFLTLPLEDWYKYLEKSGVGRIHSGHSIPESENSIRAVGGIVPSILASPAFAMGGFEGGRTFTFVVGMFGILFLGLTLRTWFSPKVLVAGIALTFISIPFLLHLMVFNLDIFLFTTFCIALYFLSQADARRINPWTTALAIFAIPLMHTRAVFIAMFLLLILLVRIRSQERAKLFQFAVGTVVGATVFLAVQWYMYRSYQNMRSMTFDIEPWTIPARIALEWTQARHGLFIYFPMALFALAGLFAASLKRNIIALAGLCIFLGYSATIIVQDASESFPGRLWVICYPVFTFGICYALQNLPKERVPRLSVLSLLSLLVLVSGLQVYAAFIRPDLFILNRTSSYSWNWINENIIRDFHFGVFLPIKIPWDEINLSSPNLIRAFAISGVLFSVMAGAALAMGSGTKVFRQTGAALALLGMVLLIDLSNVRIEPLGDGSCQAVSTENGLRAQKVSFENEKGRAIALKLKAPLYELTAQCSQDLPKNLTWEGMDGLSGRKGQSRMLMFINPFPSTGFDSVLLVEESKSKLDWNKSCYDVVRDQSVFRYLWREIFESTKGQPAEKTSESRRSIPGSEVINADFFG